MRNIASRIKDQEFTEHIDDMQLALFREKRLNQQSREEVFKHLAHCKRCRDVLKVVSEIEAEEKKTKPANNINYKKIISLTIASSLLLTFGTLPAMENFPDETNFKGVFEEKSFLDKTVYYWQCRFNEIFR